LAGIEIDAAKLPETTVLDTGILFLGLAHKVHRPESELCRALWKALIARERLGFGARVLIPAPALAEIMRGAPRQDPPRVAGVFVAPFTSRTARLMGQYLHSSVIETVVGATKLPRAYVKYDAMIAATAIAQDATLISLDGWFHREAVNGKWPIRVARPEEFQRAQLRFDKVE
jgi:predicted nucleic acid-binding protein